MDEHDIAELIKQKIGNIRPRLLDLSRNNPLIATKLGPRSSSHIRVVDELPEVLFYKLNNGQAMRIIPLPDIGEDPKDEEAKPFRDALANARLTDDEYLKQMDEIDRDADDYLDRARSVERALKDRIRAELGLPPRPKKAEINLVQHAKNNGITPSYELPKREEGVEHDKHADDDIQTLLLPKDLERKLNSIISKCRTWLQETGINVLHVAYGFLEWSEPNQTQTSYAPLILSTAQLEKRRSAKGSEYWIAGLGEEPEFNTVLAEKLKIDFGIQLPPLEGAPIEAYLERIARVAPPHMIWRVRRQIAIGVFPSARMAMYHDLDPSDSGISATETVRSLLVGAGGEIAGPFAEEYAVDDPGIEKNVSCIVSDADSSQFSTLVDIANGRNVAVEGPPGTGKSQTIVNAIAGALSAGKKVLFVAEKLAALNVVKSRLEAVGLGEFLLPLQAERSTREQVISSVRSRIEMRPPAVVRDYELQVAEYKRTRDELTRYVDILKQTFRDTDMTVFEILSSSISTDEALTQLPSNVLESCRINPSFLTKMGMLRLVDMSRGIERIHRIASASTGLWKPTQLLHPERFTVERACRLARGAADAFMVLAQERRKLVAYGLEGSLDLSSLKNVESQLAACLTFPAQLRPVLSKLLEGNAAEQMSSFLDQCRACADQAMSLKAGGLREVSETALSKLEAIQSACASARLDSLNLKSLDALLFEKREALAEARSVDTALQPLVKMQPGAQNWSSADISLAHRTVAGVGKAALSCRNAALADPAALSGLKRLCSQARWLQTHRADLGKRVAMSVTASPQTLTEAAATLRSAGAFRLFSADYRRAMRLARAIILGGKRDRAGAAKLLDELATFRRNEQTFLGDAQAPILFGSHFRGTDTEIEPFERLILFYEYVNTTFGGVTQRELRNFLRSADTDDLEVLPELAISQGLDNWQVIQEFIETASCEIEALEQARSILDSNRDILDEPDAIELDALTTLATALRRNLRISAELDRDQAAARLLGAEFRGWQTDCNALAPACGWAQEALNHAGVLKPLLEADNCDNALKAVSSVLRSINAAQTQLADLCAVARIPSEHFLSVGSDELIADMLARAGQDSEGLFNHAAMATVLSEIKETGLLPLIEYHIDAGGDLTRLSDRARALAVRSLAKEVFADYGKVLAKYPGQKLDELRRELTTKDKAIIKLSQRQIRHKVFSNARPPNGVGVGRRGTWTQMALLENEIGKQQRFISVRDLTERAGAALAELKPCWMMSPLAVAQYVKKGAIQFDLCIIDEASQMPPEAAVGALLRSKQAVVVGDTNQLPPSNFFKKLVEDDEVDEDETVLDESILEMANSTFRPPRRLRWHYRSRHSGLIKFSNRLIYNDDLIVFPSANEASPNMGVEHRYIGGLYKSGTNAVEARAIVDAVLEFMRWDPNRSLGVVTLNQKQRDLIMEEFEQALGRDQAAQLYIDRWKTEKDGLEEFFIKNLENVQGDERDVIFIGTVYGPEKQGARVMQRFGPINGLAGRRRLNVLLSRAKQKIVTFSSMTAADIVVEEKGNLGTYMLKRWLEYSASGILEAGTTTQREPDSDFEIFVIDQIRSMGFDAVPQVGAAGYFVDIGVRHPDWPYGYLMGVECDGASYHSAKSARDRDRLREEVLIGLGWKIHRIWSTDWFNNPRREAERLRKAFAERLVELKAREAEFARAAHWRDEDVTLDRAAAAESKSEQPTLMAISSDPRSEPAKNKRGVGIGDTVRVRYVKDDTKTILITISKTQSDPNGGIVHYEAPIAKALLGAEEGDEVEVLVGSYVHQAVVESIRKSRRVDASPESSR